MTETKAVRTRRRILASAAHEFALHGYEATTLRAIATGADLEIGSLYFHFASKSDLLTEVLRDAVDAVLERLDAQFAELADASPAERITTAIRTHLNVLHEIRDRGAAVVHVMDAGSTIPVEGARGHARRYVARWVRLVSEAQEAGVVDPTLDTRTVTGLLIGAMNSTVGRRQLRRSEVERLAATVAAVFVRP